MNKYEGTQKEGLAPRQRLANRLRHLIYILSTRYGGGEKGRCKLQAMSFGVPIKLDPCLLHQQARLDSKLVEGQHSRQSSKHCSLLGRFLPNARKQALDIRSTSHHFLIVAGLY